MRLDSEGWKALRAAWARGARTAVWVGVTAGLSALLAVQALASRREGIDLRRRCAALDRDIERARRTNQALRDEVRALETDPVYVESLLRRWRMAGAREQVVE
jgi:orotate phosphoribosyltransferase